MTAEESGVVAALSSFLATYIAGALHPLDIIKTRFQSTPPSIQAMTARPALTTSCPSTKASPAA